MATPLPALAVESATAETLVLAVWLLIGLAVLIAGAVIVRLANSRFAAMQERLASAESRETQANADAPVGALTA